MSEQENEQPTSAREGAQVGQEGQNLDPEEASKTSVGERTDGEETATPGEEGQELPPNEVQQPTPAGTEYSQEGGPTVADQTPNVAANQEALNEQHDGED